MSKILFGSLVFLLAICAFTLYLPKQVKSAGSHGPVTLVGPPFVDPDAEDTHRASKWIAWGCYDKDNPDPENMHDFDPDFCDVHPGACDPGKALPYIVYESEDPDTVNLTQITISASEFFDDTQIVWFVRYQDNHYRWSDWSAASSFTYGSVTCNCWNADEFIPGGCWGSSPTPTPSTTTTTATTTTTTTTTVINSVTVTITVTPTATATTTVSGSATMNVNIIQPNGGEKWCLGQTERIEWDNNQYPLDVELSLDGGLSWLTIRSSSEAKKHLFGGYGKDYKYLVPNSPFFLSNNAKVRVKNCEPQCVSYDQSDGPFTISDCKSEFNLDDLNVFIWPESTVLRPGWGQNFAARVLLKDLTDVTHSSSLVWSLTLQSIGLIDQNGYFVAGQTEGNWKDLVSARAAYSGMSAEDFAEVTIDKNAKLPGGRDGFRPLHDILLRLIGVNADTLFGDNGLLKGFFTDGSPLDTFAKMLLTLLGALQMISYLMLPKRRPLWGVVYDSLSKKPISGAVLSLLDQNGKSRDKQRTNEEGFFGFLAPAGKYSINIYREKYIFPSRFVKGRVDGRYENLYYGGEFTARAESLSTTERAPIYLNIPLDKAKLKLPHDLLPLVYNSLRYLVSTVRMPLIIFGSILAFYLAARNQTLVNILIAALYALIWVVEIKNTIKPNRFGVVEDKEGNPLGLAIIRAIDKSGKIKGTTTTAPDGKFNMNLVSGVYNFSVVKNGYKKTELKNVKISKLEDFGRILIRLEKI